LRCENNTGKLGCRGQLRGLVVAPAAAADSGRGAGSVVAPAAAANGGRSASSVVTPAAAANGGRGAGSIIAPAAAANGSVAVESSKLKQGDYEEVKHDRGLWLLE
jgi:hypothetical protein